MTDDSKQPVCTPLKLPSRLSELSGISGKSSLDTFAADPTRSPIFGSVLPILTDFSDESTSVDYWNLDHADYRGQPRTKAICTIGSNTKAVPELTKLVNAGMNVVRCNFSHGTHDYHRSVIQNIRQVMRDTRKLCAVMLDTKGPEIRTGMLQGGQPVSLKRDQSFTLTTDESVVGDATIVAVLYQKMPQVLKKGNTVLIDDGLIELTVVSTTDTTIKCTVMNDGILGQQKGVNLPGVIVDLPAVTQKDVADIKFGVEMGVDFIAASFVRKAEDVRTIREVLGQRGRNIKIISKIENQEGIENFDEILIESDGIMVARGDLGVEIPIERVCLAQKLMIRKCNAAGKIVVTATQMLESMCENPSPTRAEASDVANAVFDGTDCVMLSGETAKGKYPTKAVRMMADICREAERSINYTATFRSIHERSLGAQDGFSVVEGIAAAAVKASFDLKAALVIVLSASGTTGRLVSKYRPSAPILMLTEDEQVARQGLVSRGTVPLLVGCMTGGKSLVTRAIQVAKQLGMCHVGDVAVIVAGSGRTAASPRKHSTGAAKEDSINMIRVVTIDY
eukprot:1059942_1